MPCRPASGRLRRRHRHRYSRHIVYRRQPSSERTLNLHRNLLTLYNMSLIHISHKEKFPSRSREEEKKTSLVERTKLLPTKDNKHVGQN